MSSEHIDSYVTFLFRRKNYCVSSIKSQLAAINFFGKKDLKNNLTNSFVTEKLLKKYEKDSSKTRRERKPITKKVLNELLKNISQTEKEDYYKHGFMTLFSIMYRMALRISEVSDYSKSFSHAIKRDNIRLVTERRILRVTLETHKHSTDKAQYEVICNPTLWRHINKFLALRGNAPGPLFCHKSGKPFTRAFILKKLKETLSNIGLDKNSYNTHSFRAGKTTDLFEKGASQEQIARIGRWKTTAYKQYIKPENITV